MAEYNFIEILSEGFLDKLRKLIWDTLEQKIKSNVDTYKKNHKDNVVYLDNNNAEGLDVGITIIMPRIMSIDSSLQDTGIDTETYKFKINLDWSEQYVNFCLGETNYFITKQIGYMSAVWGSHDYILEKIKTLYDEGNHQECMLIYSFIKQHIPYLLPSLNKVPGADTVKWLGQQTDKKLLDILWNYKGADLFISDLLNAAVNYKADDYMDSDRMVDNSWGIYFDFEDFIEESYLSEYVSDTGELTTKGTAYINTYMETLFKDKEKFEEQLEFLE